MLERFRRVPRLWRDHFYSEPVARSRPQARRIKIATRKIRSHLGFLRSEGYSRHSEVKSKSGGPPGDRTRDTLIKRHCYFRRIPNTLEYPRKIVVILWLPTRLNHIERSAAHALPFLLSSSFNRSSFAFIYPSVV